MPRQLTSKRRPTDRWRFGTKPTGSPIPTALWSIATALDSLTRVRILQASPTPSTAAPFWNARAPPPTRSLTANAMACWSRAITRALPSLRTPLTNSPASLASTATCSAALSLSSTTLSAMSPSAGTSSMESERWGFRRSVELGAAHRYALHLLRRHLRHYLHVRWNRSQRAESGARWPRTYHPRPLRSRRDHGRLLLPQLPRRVRADAWVGYRSHRRATRRARGQIAAKRLLTGSF